MNIGISALGIVLARLLSDNKIAIFTKDSEVAKSIYNILYYGYLIKGEINNFFGKIYYR